MNQNSETERFSIGAAAAISGVPVETLRTWERRYGFPSPDREKGGRRHYSLAEVERIRAVAQLVATGERVRDLADLDATGLAERLSLHSGQATEKDKKSANTGPIRLVVIHPNPPANLGGPSPSGRVWLEIAASVGRAEALDPALRADALLLHASVLPADPGALLDALEARLDPDAVVILASYLPAATRRMLEARGARILDEGERADALRSRIEDAVLAARLWGELRPTRSEAPAALFTRAQLERLLNAPNGVPCECPVHLSALILRLREFERFSRQCAQDTPAQTALHAALGDGSAEAASILEALLLRVCQEDGVDPRG